MPSPKNRAQEVVGALLELSADDDQTFEEAEGELRTAGVDVQAFISRVKMRIQAQGEEDRLAWLSEARRGLASARTTRSARDYKDLDRAALITLVQERQAHVAFHRLQEQTDEDLRTTLMDLDELADDDENPT